MTFPDLFAVVRSQRYNQPCFQLLQSNLVRNRSVLRRNEQEYHTIANLDGLSLERLPVHRMTLQCTATDIRIHTLRYAHPSFHDIQEVKYWYLPYVLGSHCRIPILEFQYRSWLPTHYQPIEIRMNSAEFMDVVSVIQEERLEQIRRMEGGPRRQIPLMPSISQFGGPDDHDDRLIEDASMFVGVRTRRNSYIRTPTPSPPRGTRVIERIVERVVEVPVERVVLQTRIQALPKPMAFVLLANARQGTENCPITATPLSECSKISLTSCFHFFETEALNRWRSSHSTCPVCRSTIESVVSEE